eukprot:356298-Chlamydomonas_euryale.AAC.6
MRPHTCGPTYAQAWNLHTGTSSPVVCVIDTGLNFKHPDLSGNVDVRLGLNAITNAVGSAVDDDHSHGSHCAGEGSAGWSLIG